MVFGSSFSIRCVIFLSLAVIQVIQWHIPAMAMLLETGMFYYLAGKLIAFQAYLVVNSRVAQNEQELFQVYNQHFYGTANVISERQTQRLIQWRQESRRL